MNVSFSQVDLDKMAALGREKLQNANALGTRHVNKFRKDTIGGYVDGFKGEWAVCDALGLDRVANVTGRANQGFNVTKDGVSIEVRYTKYRTGRIMCPANKKIKADVVVLVVAGATDREVKIVGGITRERFYDEAALRDFGHGDTYFVEQSKLLPWQDWMAIL